METQQLAPVIVYAEATPNPATMKFVADRLLVSDGFVHEYTTPESTGNSPLAAKLFNFPFLTGIFIASNFITLTKNNIVDWNDVALELREYLQDYLSKGGITISRSPALPQGKGESTDKADSAETSFSSPPGRSGGASSPRNEVEQKIMEILEEYVRPAVEQDGGAIHFKSFADGILRVTLRGACSGCPSSSVTLKAGIKGIFERMLPDVKDVVAEEA